VFDIKDITERVGGPDAFQRVLDLQARIVKRNGKAVAAVVGAAANQQVFEVMVSDGLQGRCSCGPTGSDRLCDHAAAAALEWILEGEVREPTPYRPPASRFS
jgi:hypothetical protein